MAMKKFFKGIGWRLPVILTCICFSVGHVKAANTVYGYEYVDLGLPSGLLWATCNVGASSPEEYGDYFAWGDIYEQFGGGNGAADASKYSVLPAEYDAATTFMNWCWLPSTFGNERYVESWRMPTYDEMLELKNNTTISTETVNGVEGRRLTSKKNSKSIFIPFCGNYVDGEPKNIGIYANLWTSSSYNNSQGHACWFKNSSALTFGGVDSENKMCIRPVCPPVVKATGISLNYQKIDFEEHYCIPRCWNKDDPDNDPHMFLLKATITPENATEQYVNIGNYPGNEDYLAEYSPYQYLYMTGRWYFLDFGNQDYEITVTTMDGTNLSTTCRVTVRPESLSSGKCGDNLSYTVERHYDPSYSGSSWEELTISGHGDMYSNMYSPIYEFDDPYSPKLITFNGTPTSLGNCAFAVYELNLTNFLIPNSIEKIGDFVFSGSYITDITIPKGVIKIGQNPFSYCNYLSAINVESGNTEYDSRENCNAIIETATNTLIAGCSNTVIPNTVKKIASYAFELDNMSTLTIPKSVNIIEPYAFLISEIESLYVQWETPLPISEDTGIGSDMSATLYVPRGTKSAYQQAEGWQNFTNIEEYDYIDENTVPLEGISLNQSSITREVLEVGSEETPLNLTLSPANASISKVIWSSSNENVAYVCSTNWGTLGEKDLTCLVEYLFNYDGNCFGTATITATVVDEDGHTFTADCEVTIKPETTTGKCGEDVYYKIEHFIHEIGSTCEDYSISVWGTGDMYDFLPSQSPFPPMTTHYHSGSLTFDIAEGVTSIGDYAFVGFGDNMWDMLDQVTLPTTIKKIGKKAFANNENLRSVENLELVETIADDAFDDCLNLLIPVDHIEYIDPELVLAVGEEFGIIGKEKVRFIPNYATNKDDYLSYSQWSSSNPDVLFAQYEWGDFVAIAPGTADIIFNGKKFCTVTVLAPKESDTDISQYSNIIFAQEQEMWGGEEDYITLYMNNTIEVNAFSFNMQLPEGFEYVLNAKGRPVVEWIGDREDDHTLTCNLLADGSLNVAGISLGGYTISGNEGALLRVKVKVPEDVDDELNLVLRNIELADLASNPYKVERCVSTLIVKPYVLGDVNNDHLVTIADASGVVGMVVGTAPATLNRKAADVNKDNTVSIADASGIVAIVINYQPSAKAPLRDAKPIDFSLTAGAMSMAEDGTAELPICLNNAEQSTALQFDLALPAGMTLVGITPSEDHVAQFSRQSDGIYRIAILSLQNELFADATVMTLTLQGNGRVIKASAIEVVDSNLNPCHPCDAFFSIDATGIETVGTDMDTMTYDLFGRRNDTRSNGIRIMGDQKVLNK